MAAEQAFGFYSSGPGFQLLQPLALIMTTVSVLVGVPRLKRLFLHKVYYGCISCFLSAIIK